MLAEKYMKKLLKLLKWINNTYTKFINKNNYKIINIF